MSQLCHFSLLFFNLPLSYVTVMSLFPYLRALFVTILVVDDNVFQKLISAQISFMFRADKNAFRGDYKRRFRHKSMLYLSNFMCWCVPMADVAFRGDCWGCVVMNTKIDFSMFYCS